MGITGLIPFLDKASRKVNVDEFRGCTVAVDSYCWLHKGAFACADKLVRGEDTDIHIKYCLKYVTMLLSKNIKPILVFDGRHLPAKAMTEAKRRESRDISKKRAAELLSLGKIEEARSYMRRSVDITHAMALALIKECRKRNVDCIVAPYEADAQLAYLNIKNYAQLVITEDSDLILFGCTKVLFKMDLDGSGTLVETAKLPLVMKCPIEHYSFDKFRQMCIMSGCDYLASLPGIGLAKARQFITATHDPNIANALRKLPSYFNKMSLNVTDEYRESFLKAEATFKHQYVYEPSERQMVRLTEPEDEDIETALCVNAGELLDPKTAFQLALGNIDPFTLKQMDDWHPDHRDNDDKKIKTDSWNQVASHPSIWSKDFTSHLDETVPWAPKIKKPEPIIAALQTRARKKVVNLVAKYVPETQDESLTIESLSSMYCVEPLSKKQKIICESQIQNSEAYSQNPHNIALVDEEITKELSSQGDKSPILENKERSFSKCLKKSTNRFSILKRFSKFPRTVLDEKNVVESKFFSPNFSIDGESNTEKDSSKNNLENDTKDLERDFTKNGLVKEANDIDKPTSKNGIIVQESPEKVSRNPFRIKSVADINKTCQSDINIDTDIKTDSAIDTQCSEIPDSQLSSSQKENSYSPVKRRSPVLELSQFRYNKGTSKGLLVDSLSEESVIENTYPFERLVTPVDSQLSYGDSPPKPVPHTRPPPPISTSQPSKQTNNNGIKRPTCKVPGLRRTASLPSNQPTLLSKFGFQKKPVLKR